tara:strand:+ start:33 stop:329 length:297 start_codon:yes stop_codon:yes gene_type:complete
MANRNNNRGSYKAPAGMSEDDHRRTLQEILNILQQKEPIGGYKSPHPSLEDLDALQEVVNYLKGKGLSPTGYSSKPQGPQRSRGSRREVPQRSRGRRR